MENKEIRNRIMRSGIKHWQVAREIGISAESLVRWLRIPLTTERKEKVTAAINRLVNEMEG